MFAAALCGCTDSSRTQFDEEKEAHFVLGRSRVNALDYRGAIESFGEALEANPRSAAAHFELGVLYAERESDPAAAIYHYQQYLRLRPGAPNAEMIRDHIMRLKTDLARTLLPVTPPEEMQKRMDELAQENQRLRDEVERYKSFVNARAVVTNQPPAQAQARNGPAAVGGASGGASPGRTAAPPSRTPRPVAVARTHLVRSGETPSSIARRYNLKLEKLLAANPGLNARRMKIGQSLNVPLP